MEEEAHENLMLRTKLTAGVVALARSAWAEWRVLFRISCQNLTPETIAGVERAAQAGDSETETGLLIAMLCGRPSKT